MSKKIDVFIPVDENGVIESDGFPALYLKEELAERHFISDKAGFTTSARKNKIIRGTIEYEEPLNE